jgi:hypothetical protein
MPERRSVGSFIWPHLAAHEPAELQPVRREPPSPLAAAMYPAHVPKPPPPTPRPKMTREEIFRDFARNMDAESARLWGFRKIGPR